MVGQRTARSDVSPGKLVARWARPIGARCIGIGAVTVVAPLALADPDDFSMTSTTRGWRLW